MNERVHKIIDEELAKSLLSIQMNIAKRLGTEFPDFEIVVPGRTECFVIRGGPSRTPGLLSKSYSTEFGIAVIEVRENR